MPLFKIQSVIDALKYAQEPMVIMWWKGSDGEWRSALYASDPNWYHDNGQWFLEWL